MHSNVFYFIVYYSIYSILFQCFESACYNSQHWFHNLLIGRVLQNTFKVREGKKGEKGGWSINRLIDSRKRKISFPRDGGEGWKMSEVGERVRERGIPIPFICLAQSMPTDSKGDFSHPKDWPNPHALAFTSSQHPDSLILLPLAS